MAKRKGWIPIYRSILNSSIWNIDEPFTDRSAYVDLLLMANYEDKQMIPRGNKKVITIHRGELLTSYEHLAERWKWSRGKVIRYLKMLEQCNLVHIHGTAYGTTLTLLEYDICENQRNADDTTLGTPDRTSGGTAHGTAHGTRLKNNKNNKKDKKEKEIKKVAAQPGVFSWEGEPE